MKDNRTLAVVALVGAGAYLLYRRSQGLPLFSFGGDPTLGSIAGQGDPRFQRNLVGIQGTGNTNPIAAALGGLSSAVAKLFGSAAFGAPARNAPATGGPTGALNAGGTYTTGLPPGGDRTHDPFAGFDQFDVWQPDMSVFGDPYAVDYSNMASGFAAPGIPGQDTSFDGFVGLER